MCPAFAAAGLAAGPDGVRDASAGSNRRARWRSKIVWLSRIRSSTLCFIASCCTLSLSATDRRSALSCGRGDRAINSAIDHQRPNDAGHLVRERHGDHSEWPPPAQGHEPSGPGSTPAAQNVRCAEDQQASQVAIALFADRSQPLLAAAGFLSRRKAKPGGEVPGRTEPRWVGDHRQQCACNDRFDTRNGRQPTSSLVRTDLRGDLFLQRIEPASNASICPASSSRACRAGDGSRPSFWSRTIAIRSSSLPVPLAAIIPISER